MRSTKAFPFAHSRRTGAFPQVGYGTNEYDLHGADATTALELTVCDTSDATVTVVSFISMSRQEAGSTLLKNPFFASWNPEVLELFVQYALCDAEDGGVQLKMPRFLVCTLPSPF